jgi:hypothetical protein
MDHVEEKISLFIDHELPDAEQEALFLHLAQCESCRALLTEMTCLKNRVADYYNQAMPAVSSPQMPTLSIKPDTRMLYRQARYFYFAAAVFLLICFAWLNNSRHELEIKCTNLGNEISTLRETVRARTITEPASTPARKEEPSLPGKSPVRRTGRSRFAEPASGTRIFSGKNISSIMDNRPQFVTVKLTGEDFVGFRMVGN